MTEHADLTIPAFLLVKNRKPLTAAEEARVAAFMRRAKRTAETDVPEWFKGNRSQLPRTMTPEAWAFLETQERDKRQRTEARIDALRESKGQTAVYQRESKQTEER